MNQIKIEVVEAQFFEAGGEGGLDAFGPVIGIPQFGGDENIFTREFSGSQAGLQRGADFEFVAIALGAIEVAKSGGERVSGGGARQGWVGNQSAKAERGQLAAAVVQRNFRQAQIGRVSHRYTSKVFCVRHRRAAIRELDASCRTMGATFSS